MYIIRNINGSQDVMEPAIDLPAFHQKSFFRHPRQVSEKEMIVRLTKVQTPHADTVNLAQIKHADNIRILERLTENIPEIPKNISAEDEEFYQIVIEKIKEVHKLTIEDYLTFYTAYKNCHFIQKIFFSLNDLCNQDLDLQNKKRKKLYIHRHINEIYQLHLIHCMHIINFSLQEKQYPVNLHNKILQLLANKQLLRDHRITALNDKQLKYSKLHPNYLCGTEPNHVNKAISAAVNMMIEFQIDYLQVIFSLNCEEHTNQIIEFIEYLVHKFSPLANTFYIKDESKIKYTRQIKKIKYSRAEIVKEKSDFNLALLRKNYQLAIKYLNIYEKNYWAKTHLLNCIIHDQFTLLVDFAMKNNKYISIDNLIMFLEEIMSFYEMYSCFILHSIEMKDYVNRIISKATQMILSIKNSCHQYEISQFKKNKFAIVIEKLLVSRLLSQDIFDELSQIFAKTTLPATPKKSIKSKSAILIFKSGESPVIYEDPSYETNSDKKIKFMRNQEIIPIVVRPVFMPIRPTAFIISEYQFSIKYFTTIFKNVSPVFTNHELIDVLTKIQNEIYNLPPNMQNLHFLVEQLSFLLQIRVSSFYESYHVTSLEHEINFMDALKHLLDDASNIDQQINIVNAPFSIFRSKLLQQGNLVDHLYLRAIQEFLTIQVRCCLNLQEISELSILPLENLN